MSANTYSEKENEIEKWLKSIGLVQYFRNFQDEGFDDLHTIAWTFSNGGTECKEMLTKMGIEKLGHQQKIVYQAQILKQQLEEKGNLSLLIHLR
jgi:hypothetical protein